MDYKYEVLNNLFFFYSMLISMMLFGWLISMVTPFFVLSIALNFEEKSIVYGKNQWNVPSYVHMMDGSI